MKNSSLIWKQFLNRWKSLYDDALAISELNRIALLSSLFVTMLVPSQYAFSQDDAPTKVFDMVVDEPKEEAKEQLEAVNAGEESLGVEQNASVTSELREASERSPTQTPEAETKEPEIKKPDSRTTAEKLEDLKEEVLAVNRDLFILEEDLLFPASTQLATYFSVDIGYFFSLDNIKVKIDDKQVSHFLYTEKDVNALYRGAIQKVYLGNVSTGEHEIVAVLIGHGPRKREYKVAVSAKFEKTTEAKAIEIQLRDDTGKLQPKLNVVEW